MQVQHQGQHRTLEVVAHLAVGGVGIGAVELYPGLLTAGTQALQPPPSTEQVAAQIRAQILEQLRLAAAASAVGQKLIHIAGDSLSKPEGGHHHRLVVAIRTQLGRPQPAHVPLVQVFVGG